MPTYSFINDKTGEEWEEMMSMAEREQCLKDNPHIRTIITQVNIVAGVGGIKNDGGWQENLDRIASAHPTSELAASRGSRHSTKEVKTRIAVEKWKKARAKDNV